MFRNKFETSWLPTRTRTRMRTHTRTAARTKRIIAYAYTIIKLITLSFRLLTSWRAGNDGTNVPSCFCLLLTDWGNLQRLLLS